MYLPCIITAQFPITIHRHCWQMCLMREKVTESYPNDLGELLAHVQKEHKTGYIISRFLLNAQEDGVLFDFYKTYIEILV